MWFTEGDKHAFSRSRGREKEITVLQQSSFTDRLALLVS
jgi:hypothetical protein